MFPEIVALSFHFFRRTSYPHRRQRFEFDRTGIPGWQRRDIRNQLGLIHGASFFIRENGIVGEILLPGSLVARNDGIVQLLRSPNQFVLGNGSVSLSRGSEV